jgi:hypothetical protein
MPSRVTRNGSGVIGYADAAWSFFSRRPMRCFIRKMKCGDIQQGLTRVERTCPRGGIGPTSGRTEQITKKI